MSVSDNELRGMLSEAEIKYVGLGLAHSILFGHYDGDDDNFEKVTPKSPPPIVSLPSTFSPSRLKDAARMVGGLTVKTEIRATLNHSLMREETDAAISAYLRSERIPAVYHSLVSLDDCIEILVRGIFYKVAGLPRKVSLDAEVTHLCSILKTNEEKMIAYDRVGILQRFIHEKMRLHGDTGIVERLSVESMRCLLGMARLHLNINDFKSGDPGYAIFMNEMSSARAALEFLSPSPPPIASEGKKIYPRWRVRHMRPLSYFYRRTARRRLSALLALDIELKFDDFVNAACRSYALTGGTP